MQKVLSIKGDLFYETLKGTPKKVKKIIILNNLEQSIFVSEAKA